MSRLGWIFARFFASRARSQKLDRSTRHVWTQAPLLRPPGVSRLRYWRNGLISNGSKGTLPGHAKWQLACARERQAQMVRLWVTAGYVDGADHPSDCIDLTSAPQLPTGPVLLKCRRVSSPFYPSIERVLISLHFPAFCVDPHALRS